MVINIITFILTHIEMFEVIFSLLGGWNFIAIIIGNVISGLIVYGLTKL